MEFKLMTPNEVTRSRRPARRQGNGGGRRRDAARVALLPRVLRVRSLAKQAMTDGQLRVYFYNLDDRIKRHIMDQDPAIAERWKLADEMPAWEFIERTDRSASRPPSRAQLLRP